MNRLSALAAAVAALATVGLWAPTDARAQSPGSDQTEQLIDEYDPAADQSPADESDSPDRLPEPSVSRINLDLTWRNWKRTVADGNPTPDQLARLIEDTRALGYRNAVDYATASSRVLEDHADQLSLADVTEAFRTIESLAPDLPRTHLAEARYFADYHPTNVERLFGAYADGLRRTVAWPNTRTLLAAYGWVALLVLAATGFGVVIVGQILRHLPIATHDIARVLPGAVTRGQIVAALLLGAAVLFVWTQSILVAVLALVCLASVSQSWNERLFTLGAALAVALLPYAEAHLAKLAAFPGSDARALLEAQYLRCDAACLDELNSTIESGDPGFRYTAGLAILRGSTDAPRERAVSVLTDGEAPPDDLAGYFANLRGAALLSVGDTDRAIEALQTATERMDDPTAAWFNLMRAYRRAGHDDRASDASEQASRHDVESVRHKSEFDRENPASLLMLPPLPESYFLERHAAADVPDRAAVLTDAWRRVAGPRFEIDDATAIGGGAGVAVLLLSIVSVLGFASRPCPNCGLAREPDDEERTAGHPHCLPCYRTFVGGAELGYKARVHYETLLGRRSTTQMVLRRTLSVLIPGAGHSLAGRPAAGFTLAAMLGAGLYLAVSPDWLWRPARSLAGTDFVGAGYLGCLLVAIGALVALGSAWRDIEPLELQRHRNSDREAS